MSIATVTQVFFSMKTLKSPKLEAGIKRSTITIITITPFAISMPAFASQILVKIAAAGINFVDTYLRSGLYKPPSMPFTMGKEGAGIIEVCYDLE